MITASSFGAADLRLITPSAVAFLEGDPEDETFRGNEALNGTLFLASTGLVPVGANNYLAMQISNLLVTAIYICVQRITGGGLTETLWALFREATLAPGSTPVATNNLNFAYPDHNSVTAAYKFQASDPLSGGSC